MGDTDETVACEINHTQSQDTETGVSTTGVVDASKDKEEQQQSKDGEKVDEESRKRKPMALRSDVWESFSKNLVTYLFPRKILQLQLSNSVLISDHLESWTLVAVLQICSSWSEIGVCKRMRLNGAYPAKRRATATVLVSRDYSECIREKWRLDKEQPTVLCAPCMFTVC
ncbi:hypothetical protein OsJ_00541 [Oryza sativa Japonica Group]|uniref:Uncharacterized protein n=1 Tax=Oryza sativa subsp. japonica TaxID=39947 RepID=B9ET32_ORYSJ|nr:hypothetical protein OsJ_00541 [Oryza sativa Japonica Group]